MIRPKVWLTQWREQKSLLLHKSDQCECLRNDTRTVKNVVVISQNSSPCSRNLPQSGTPWAVVSLNSTRTQFLGGCNPSTAFYEPTATDTMYINIREQNNCCSKLLEPVRFHNEILKTTSSFPHYHVIS